MSLYTSNKGQRTDRTLACNQSHFLRTGNSFPIEIAAKMDEMMHLITLCYVIARYDTS